MDQVAEDHQLVYKYVCKLDDVFTFVECLIIIFYCNTIRADATSSQRKRTKIYGLQILVSQHLLVAMNQKALWRRAVIYPMVLFQNQCLKELSM